MSVPVLVCGPLMALVNERSRILAEGPDLRTLLGSIDGMHPGFLRQVFPPGGPSPVCIFVNGTDMNRLAGLDTPVSPADEVIVLSPMSGG
jgi:molybdopterin converting factor small subunit